MKTFIYPASRSTLFSLLARAGILPELGVPLSGGPDADFWSYADDLEERGNAAEKEVQFKGVADEIEAIEQSMHKSETVLEEVPTE